MFGSTVLLPRLVAVALVLASVAASAAGGKAAPAPKLGDVEISRVWMREAHAGETAHVFLTVRNNGPVPVRLGGGRSDAAAEVRLVRFVVVGPFLRTRLVDPVTIEPHGQFAFGPGVAALELWKLKGDLRKGGKLPVTFVFPGAGTIDATVEIDGRAAVRYDDAPPEIAEDGR